MNSPTERKKTTLSTFLWILVGFMVLYFLFIWLTPKPRYTGVEDIKYNDLYSMMDDNTSVMYYLPDCPHCNQQLPLYKQFSQELPTVRFLTVNAADEKIPSSEELVGFPTIKVYNGKQMSGQILGAQDKEKMKSRITELVKQTENKNILQQLLSLFSKNGKEIPKPIQPVQPQVVQTTQPVQTQPPQQPVQTQTPQQPVQTQPPQQPAQVAQPRSGPVQTQPEPVESQTAQPESLPQQSAGQL